MNDFADDIELPPRGFNSLFHRISANFYWNIIFILGIICYHAIKINYLGPLENSLKCLNRKKHIRDYTFNACLYTF